MAEQSTPAATRTPVTSSNMRSVGFIDGALHIEFKNGKVYQYVGPTAEAHFHNLMRAESKGRYFLANIRNDPELKYAQVKQA